MGAPVPALPTVSSMLSRNEGAVTIVDADGLHAEVSRIPAAEAQLLAPDGSATLAGTWTDQPDRTMLAIVRLT
ncbi:MAG: hypothetical protein JWQ39_1270 [Glaciihabitans sp.]|nr:hypothetical protein [Glaciihabitans sp.]